MSFWRSVSVLVGGTALGHGITAATLPILTRLYGPEDFGIYASFSAVVATFAVAACLRYEISINIASTREESSSLVRLSLAMATLVGIAALFLLALAATFPQHPRFSSLGHLVYAAPLAMVLAGIMATLQNWLIREGDFAAIARTRVLQSASTATVQITLGWAQHLGVGLIVGYVGGFAAAALGLGARIARGGLPRSDNGGISFYWHLAKKYSNFPRYSTPEALLNSAALQVPILLIASLTGPSEAGYILLAMSVLQAPMSLVGSAIGQVFFSRASPAVQTGELPNLLIDTTEKLGRLGLGPIVAVSIAAPLFVPLFFGDSWHRTGALMVWMGPWFAAQFLTSPVSVVLQVLHKQKAALVLQGLGFVFRVAVIFGAHLLSATTGEAFALANFVFYCAYFLVIARIAGVRWGEVARIIGGALPYLAGWGTIAVIAVVIAR